MKIAHYLSISMVGIFIVSTAASADPSITDPSSNAYLQVDPDGIPLSLAPGQNTRPNQGEADAIRKEQQQAALDKNWLLRNYEHQLQIHATSNSTNDPHTNLYYQLSSNKELAKLAGLPDLTSDDQGGASSSANRNGMPHTAQTSVNLRPDTSSGAKGGSISHSELFKPLVAPLSAPDAAGLHNFYSTLASSMASPLGGSTPLPAPAPRQDQAQDSVDIETPGMIAAEKDPLMDPSATNLTLDVLPGETAAQARAEQRDKSNPSLPAPPTADQLHKSQNASLNSPTPQQATAQTSAPAAVAAKPIPVNEEDAPTPVSREPVINPVRPPIANPYDILDR